MTDLIDRNALRRDIDEMCRLTGFDTPMTAIYCVKRVIERQPTIDPESLRPVGRWECKAEPFYICSNCKKEVEMFACDDMMDYCPHCGAKMEVQDDG